MRRGFGFGMAILAILLAFAIGAGAYHWGYVNGLGANGHATVVQPWAYGGGGFFPFGFVLFPLLFFFLFFGLARAAFWGRHGWHDHDHPHSPIGPGGRDKRQQFEDWHRRQHQPGEGSGGSAGGMPTSV